MGIVTSVQSQWSLLSSVTLLFIANPILTDSHHYLFLQCYNVYYVTLPCFNICYQSSLNHFFFPIFYFSTIRKHQNSNVFRRYRNVIWKNKWVAEFHMGYIYCGSTQFNEIVLITFSLKEKISFKKISVLGQNR